MAQPVRRGPRTCAQRRGKDTEASANKEPEGPGLTETLAVHPGGAMNTRFQVRVQSLHMSLSPSWSFCRL